MRKIKISLMAAAFVLTAGITVATASGTGAACSTQENGQGQMLDSGSCSGNEVTCCFLIPSNNIVQKNDE